MELLLSVTIGLLYAAGIYLMMSRSFAKLIFGVILIGNGANLLIFLLGRIVKGSPPIIGADENVLSTVVADPVPQALVLTAIVIGFGMQSFAIVLVKRMYKDFETDDIDDLNTTDSIE